MNRQETVYQIAGVRIRLCTPFPIADDDAFALYRASEDAVKDGKTYTITFVPSEELPDLIGYTRIFGEHLNSVYRKGEELFHVFSVPGRSQWKAWNVIPDWSAGDNCVLHYYPDMRPYLEVSCGCFNAITIERILRAESRYIFHCCYVNTRHGALLFTAPSGGGKSTQGNLWEASGKGSVINGDRAVLEVIEEQAGSVCLAHGLPVAGSSNIFKNETHPVKAIIAVHKAQKNRIYQVRGMEAFYSVYGQIVTHVWDPAFQNQVMDMAQKIVETVPVYHLDCTISEEAVRITEEAEGITV